MIDLSGVNLTVSGNTLHHNQSPPIDKKLGGIIIMEKKINISNLLSKVAKGKCRRSKHELLEASAKYLGVKNPKHKY